MVTRECTGCGEQTRNDKFCSKSCAATYNNKAYPKRSFEGKCGRCGEPISSGRTYCKPCYRQKLEDKKAAVAERNATRGFQPRVRLDIAASGDYSCRTSGCENKAKLVKEGIPVCQSCFFGLCVSCGNKASRSGPEGNLCQVCVYGRCYECGEKAVTKNDKGSLCTACFYGLCKICGDKGRHPGEGGSLCRNCYYGPCSLCGIQGKRKNAEGAVVCAKCFLGPCVICGCFPQKKTPEGAKCRRCILGKCHKCGVSAYKTDALGKSVCRSCVYGICSAPSCTNKAGGRRTGTDTYICSLHQRHGIEYVKKASSWHSRTKYLYVVYWEKEKVLKYGVGVSMARHKQWVTGGAELLRLFELDDTTSDGWVLLKLEAALISRAVDAKYGIPSRIELPKVMVESGMSNKETFLAVEESVKSLLSEIVVNAVSKEYPVREVLVQ